MLKRDEMLNPASCLLRAHENEMIFVLLARDVAAANTIRYWAAERVRLGRNHPSDEQIQEALECANEMDRQLTQLRRLSI